MRKEMDFISKGMIGGGSANVDGKGLRYIPTAIDGGTVI